MSDSIQAGAKQIFSEHQEEIRRRSAVASQFSNDVKGFEQVEDDTTIPFRDEAHSFVVFSLSHREFGPVCSDSNNPGLCLYGAFETYDEAREYAILVSSKHPSYSVLVDETHKWLGGWSSPSHLQDEGHVSSTVSRVLNHHKEKAEQEKAAFEENVREKRCGATTCASEKEEVGTRGGAENKDSKATEKKEKISKDLAVEDQSLCSLTVLSDPSDEAEFMFQVYAFHDKESSANTYIRNVCGNHIVEYNIDVVKARTWIFPQSMDPAKAPREVYRSTELDSIMKTHRGSQGKVDEFYRQNQGYTPMPPPSLTSDANKTSPCIETAETETLQEQTKGDLCTLEEGGVMV